MLRFLAFCTVFTVAVVVTLLHPTASASFGGGAPAQYTGAPGNQTCAARGCHDSFALNSGTGTMTTSLVSTAGYAPGDTLDFDVTVEQAGARRYGFQVTARDAADQEVGTFELIDTGTEFADRNPAYVTHSGLSTSGTWSVRWIAPAASASAVTFYLAGNAANRNGTAKGDHIYTTTASVPVATSTANETTPLPRTLTLAPPAPNPSSTYTSLTYTLTEAAPVTFTAYDVQGRQIYTASAGVRTAGTHRHTLPIATWPTGHYILRLSTPHAFSTTSLVKY